MSNNQEQLKQRVAEYALKYVEDGEILGVGTGSTVNYLIEAIAASGRRLEGAVASSKATAELLQRAGIRCLELNHVQALPRYIDGADQANSFLQLIKGGGGALTREKIIASAAEEFICIVDETKVVEILGEEFPVPVEVLPLARSYVAHELIKLGGRPLWRENFSTDNGNQILDVHNLEILEPIHMEQQINHIPGVVCCGIFAMRPADRLLIASASGIEERT